ncbi:MAG: glutathione S-transferase N-terminal domain-containing protein [Myxococcaceae bacterium]|nr:glutathione S-transferase N-terminal domain-containing protein [Myxococcaceae bacterium]
MKPTLATVTSDTAKALARTLSDPTTGLSRKLQLLGGFTASGLRLARGTTVERALGPRPAQTVRLWDFEGCPHSRSVREALSCLDLDAEVRPCPPGGARFRSELGSGAGPQLEDPNTGQRLVGAPAIVSHLYAKYGAGTAPWLVNAAPVRVATGLLARVLTAGRGAIARPSKAPEQPLELYSFESSPPCRMVRFTLCELELPYVLHNVAKGSPRRDAFIARSGKMQVPWLADPNTGWQGFESLEIERYLERTYGGS